MTDDDKAIIFECLDNAVENSQFGFVMEASLGLVAADLMDCASAVEGMDATEEDIIEAIKEWRALRQC